MKEIKIFERLSLLPQGVRYKLLIAFSLMSVIPLLVIGYLVNNFILLEEELTLGQTSLVVLFCVIIAWLGLFLAKKIVDRVLDMALEAKIITDGNYDRRVHIDTGDEIGQIGEAINFLTKKIKSNITDLKDYQDKMKEINLDIQKKVLVLSNLLQIGELIASSVTLDSILELILTKLSQFYEEGFAALYLSTPEGSRFTLRSAYNLENKDLLNAAIEEGQGLLGKAIQKRKHVVIDASSKFSSKEYQEFKKEYKCENAVAFPIGIAKWIKALLLVGNNIKNFTFTNDDIEVIKVFTEQISIAIQNDFLLNKAKRLEIKDELTGLFNKPYIINRLREEIQRSVVSQRPCSFILMGIDDFKEYEEKKGQAQGEVAMKKIAQLVSGFSQPLGKAGLMEMSTFGLIMPEVNKKEALEIAEKLRKGIEKLELSREKGDRLTASGGISENPLDGPSADDILEKAQHALNKAKQEGKNKIIAAGA